MYFYHPDHLGSSSYITDVLGEVVQHIEYFAFGETFLEEHSNTDRTPYLFNGKELDEETGLYYYGARYYDPVTSVWQSVDPLAVYNPIFEVEHYIDGQHNGGVFYSGNLNVYSYTYQNPLKYVDPNGKQVEFTYTLNYVIHPVTGWRTYIPFLSNPTVEILNSGEISNYSDNGAPGYRVTLKVPKVYAHNLNAPSYNTFIGEGDSLEDLIWKQQRTFGEVFMDGFNTGWKVGLSEAMMEAATLYVFKQLTKNISKIINVGKQGKHVVGHNNFNPSKSVLTADAQKLLDKFHKGNIKSFKKINNVKTRVDFGETIGMVKKNGELVPTTKGIIHNSKSGAHIIPANP